jgi:hypothetical protein
MVKAMKRIFVPTVSGSDWQRLLGKPELHWKSGRSAMSAAACWEESEPQLPREISDVLEASGNESLASLELLVAIPEWEVDLPGGDRPSQTDVLAITRNELGLVILGVEAKVDEEFGPTLGKQRTNASEGQLERISYLERELGCAESLDDSIRYQLLHRTVSAILTARAFHASTAVMLVHSFSPDSRWREDFEAFAEAISGKRVTDDLFEIEIEIELGQGPRLIIGWCKGAEEFLSVELPSAY